MDNSSHWTWARLNADTLFLALLAAGSGIFDLFDPSRDAVTALAIQTLGAPHWLHYVRAGVYVVAGVMLTVALLRSSVRVEIVARCVLSAGVLLNLWRHGVALGWGDSDTTSAAVLLGIVLLVTVLRLSVLLDKRGLVVTRAAVKGGA